jgi:RHS repeat-associated protein
MIRFSAKAKGAPQAKLHFIEQVALASLAPEMRDDPGQRAQLRDMVQTMSEAERKASEKGFRKALEQGFTPQMQINLSASGINPEALLLNMRRDIEAMKQIDQLPVAIEFYHCDHLGTPVALTDQQGQITWAARYDPWGNIEEEFNPNNIEQNIRLPGQYHDRETGLYYNRHRYYDPKIGAYINQDPIGLRGGINIYQYVGNPSSYIDPMGLDPYSADEIRDLVAANNKSKVPNEYVECQIWAESRFDPNAMADGSTATGLMQMTTGKYGLSALNGKNGTTFSADDMQNGAKSIEAGTMFLEMKRGENGSVDHALQRYRGSSSSVNKNYSKMIRACGDCIKKARQKLPNCAAPDDCLKKAGAK